MSWVLKTKFELMGNNFKIICERLGRYRIVRVKSPETDILLQELLPDPELVFSRGRAILSPWKNPATDKVMVEINNSEYFFKRFNDQGWRYRLKNIFRRSRAEKSWRAAWLLNDQNIPTPQPSIFLEERLWGLLHRSYILIPNLEGGKSLLEFWPLLDREEQKESLFQLAEIIGKMHRTGILHGDLNWRNILLCRDGPNLRFFLVDLDGYSLSNKFSGKLADKDIAHFLRDIDRAKVGEGLRNLFLKVWRETAGFF
jgi:tRNA A-37 threonylcarbamoyl transferase component Bud32